MKYLAVIISAILSTTYANLSGTISRLVNGSMALALDIGETVEIEMRGPMNAWFGAGFGSPIMDGTYSIIATVTENGTLSVEEWVLGPHERGTLVPTQEIEIVSDAIDTITETRSIVVTRPRFGATYNFPTETGNLDTIVSDGVDGVLEYAVARNMGAFETISLPLITTDAPTLEPTLEPTTNGIPTPLPTQKVKTPKPTSVVIIPDLTDAPDGTLPPDVMLYASAEFNFEQSLSFYMQDGVHEDIVLVMTGPSDAFYAVGFGNDMDGAYAIIVDKDGGVSERVLGAHAPGQILEDSLTVIYNQVVDGVRTVALLRDTYIINQEYFNLEPFVTDCEVAIPLIYSHGEELLDLYVSEWSEAEASGQCSNEAPPNDEEIQSAANHYVPATLFVAVLSAFYNMF